MRLPRAVFDAATDAAALGANALVPGSGALVQGANALFDTTQNSLLSFASDWSKAFIKDKTDSLANDLGIAKATFGTNQAPDPQYNALLARFKQIIADPAVSTLESLNDLPLAEQQRILREAETETDPFKKPFYIYDPATGELQLYRRTFTFDINNAVPGQLPPAVTDYIKTLSPETSEAQFILMAQATQKIDTGATQLAIAEVKASMIESVIKHRLENNTLNNTGAGAALGAGAVVGTAVTASLVAGAAPLVATAATAAGVTAIAATGSALGLGAVATAAGAVGTVAAGIGAILTFPFGLIVAGVVAAGVAAIAVPAINANIVTPQQVVSEVMDQGPPYADPYLDQLFRERMSKISLPNALQSATTRTFTNYSQGLEHSIGGETPESVLAQITGTVGEYYIAKEAYNNAPAAQKDSTATNVLKIIAQNRSTEALAYYSSLTPPANLQGDWAQILSRRTREDAENLFQERTGFDPSTEPHKKYFAALMLKGTLEGVGYDSTKLGFDPSALLNQFSQNQETDAAFETLAFDAQASQREGGNTISNWFKSIFDSIKIFIGDVLNGTSARVADDASRLQENDQANGTQTYETFASTNNALFEGVGVTLPANMDWTNPAKVSELFASVSIPEQLQQLLTEPNKTALTTLIGQEAVQKLVEGMGKLGPNLQASQNLSAALEANASDVSKKITSQTNENGTTTLTFNGVSYNFTLTSDADKAALADLVAQFNAADAAQRLDMTGQLGRGVLGAEGISLSADWTAASSTIQVPPANEAAGAGQGIAV